MKTEGDKIQAICEACGKSVDATYKIRDLTFSDGRTAKNILAIVCDECDEICAVPHKSLETMAQALTEGEDEVAELLRQRFERVNHGGSFSQETFVKELEAGKFNKYMSIDGALWTEAVDYFGSQKKALDWFQTPNLALGGEKPGIYCISHYSGDLKVREILNKLKYGMTA